MNSARKGSYLGPRANPKPRYLLYVTLHNSAKLKRVFKELIQSVGQSGNIFYYLADLPQFWKFVFEFMEFTSIKTLVILTCGWKKVESILIKKYYRMWFTNIYLFCFYNLCLVKNLPSVSNVQGQFFTFSFCGSLYFLPINHLLCFLLGFAVLAIKHFSDVVEAWSCTIVALFSHI